MMPLLFTVLGVVAAQAGLIALHRFGEIDLFWLLVLEVVWAGLSIAALFLGWAASVNWAE